MFALPTLIQHTSGENEFRNGVFIELPAELRDLHRLNVYAEIKKSGWGRSEFNYSYYAVHMPLGDFLVIPGLIVEGETRPSKKFHGYVTTVTKGQVEKLAGGFISYLNQVVELAQREMGMLVHDLRGLSNAIYNSAAAAEISLDQHDYFESKKRIETVIASQGILKMRTDALDFVGNAMEDQNPTIIPLFKKIDKVQRCFKSQALSQRKSVTLTGTSFRKASGHDVFELVPYAIIDNAVKYSPPGYDIDVNVRDNADRTILRVTSFGPEIKEHEKQSIFNRHVRANAALNAGIPGTGVGLNMVQKIVDESFSGEISVEQGSNAIELDGVKFFETSFIVSIPSFL